MGPYRIVTVFIAGFFTFGAVYHAVLWLRSGRDRTLLAIALALLSAAVASAASFLVATAETTAQGQWALNLRAMTACVIIGALGWLFALISDKPARLYLWSLTVGLLGVLAYTVLVFPVTGIVTSVQHALMPWGESISVLTRQAASSWLWVIYCLAMSVPVFGVICARHVHRRDRVGGWLLGVTATGLLLSLLFALLIDLMGWRLPYVGSIFVALWVLPIAWQVARSNRERELRLAASEQRFRAIFDQTFQFIGLLEVDGTLIEANQTALAFAGTSLADVVGRKFWDTQWWAHSSEMQERLRAAVRTAAGGAIARFEATHVGRDGRVHHIDFSLKPVFDERGTVVLLIPEGRDITERVAADEAQRKLELRLLQSRKMEALGKLASGVAHDFNNLLAVISGYTAELLAEPSEALRPHLAHLEQIRLATEQGTAMIRQLLAFSRESALEPKVMSLNALIAQSRAMLGSSLGTHIQLVVNTAPELHAVRADPDELARILLNLVVNARDAMPHGGTLTIETRDVRLDDAYAAEHGVSPGAYVLLQVSDTGSGMTPQTLARLFEPFFTTKEPGQGTGLGLAVVDGIVRQSKGCIDVESTYGLGTTFKIYLPAIEEERDSKAA